MDHKNQNQEVASVEKTFGKPEKKGGKKFSSKEYLLLGIAVMLCCLVLITLGGCSGRSATDEGSGMANESAVKDQASSDEVSSVPISGETANANVPFDTSKIIYSGNISLYTDDYQSTFNKIGAYALELGGFVENSGSTYIAEGKNVPADSGYITIRVPSAKFTEAMAEIQKFGSPISANVSSTNISQEYQDVQAQLNNLKIEEERLLEYLKQAQTVADMLAIESELNRVRTEIDSRSTTIKNWDKEIAYSTIYVSLYEKKLSGSTVSSPFSEILTKIGEGFVTSINLILYVTAFLIVLIFRLLPFAAIAGLGGFIFIRVRKKIKVKNKEKENEKGKENKEENKEEKNTN